MLPIHQHGRFRIVDWWGLGVWLYIPIDCSVGELVMERNATFDGRILSVKVMTLERIFGIKNYD